MKSWNETRKAATAVAKRWKNADRVAHLFCTLLTFLCATFDVALGDTRTELDIFAVHYAPKWYSRLGATGNKCENVNRMHSTHAVAETVQTRIFSNGLRDSGGIVFSETECSTARTDVAVHAVLNHLRYNNNREIRDARFPQFWTEGSWPQVPPLDYAIDGVKIGSMRIQTFHFSVRHPDVRHELSMFLITFLSGNDFKLAMYFNENIGRVGFTFEEATACNLRFRLITDYPYLNGKEEQKQKEVLGRMWQDSPKSKPPFPNVNIGTNDVKVTVDL